MTAKDELPNDIGSPSIESTYHLKWVQWNSDKVPIVMQRINGPCPLIAIMNVLLFREKVKLPPMLEQITAHQLMTYLGECIMDSVPEDMQNDEDALLNLEQNVHDAIEILPKLQTGLDVNVKFSGISDFEYTPECIIFDLLRIPLFHGWLCDPSMPEVHQVVGNLSYNQLVDSIITGKTSTRTDVAAKVLIAEDFLDQTASQLTHYGLDQLKNQIKDNELGILFRNNHFITLFKRDGNLYQLVTDHGFLTESIIWETLDNIEGDGKFIDCNFEIIDTKDRETKALDKKIQQLENDYLMALSLKEEESTETGVITTRHPDWETFEKPVVEPTYELSPRLREDKSIEEMDFELAKRLQAEENRLYQVEPSTENSRPDIIKVSNRKIGSMMSNETKNSPPSPESAIIRNECVSNIEQTNIRTNVEISKHLMVSEHQMINLPQSVSVDSHSGILIGDQSTSNSQQILDLPSREQSKESEKTSELRSYQTGSQLTGAENAFSEEINPENRPTDVNRLDKELLTDFEVRQRIALHNQSILAGNQVVNIVDNSGSHHQQNASSGRPNSSKLSRAPLYSI